MSTVYIPTRKEIQQRAAAIRSFREKIELAARVESSTKHRREPAIREICTADVREAVGEFLS